MPQTQKTSMHELLLIGIEFDCLKYCSRSNSYPGLLVKFYSSRVHSFPFLSEWNLNNSLVAYDKKIQNIFGC